MEHAWTRVREAGRSRSRLAGAAPREALMREEGETKYATGDFQLFDDLARSSLEGETRLPEPISPGHLWLPAFLPRRDCAYFCWPFVDVCVKPPARVFKMKCL